ncbi:MAG: ABC transporter permease subunit [Phycisphaerales bacterium]|nr:ABC transporter permease subunit [Phycisphaerales bacterium]
MPESPITSSDPGPIVPRPARRRTSAKVRVVERIAQTTITVGGLGVIAAVLAIMVVLVVAVLPLFRGGEATLTTSGSVKLAEPVLFTQTDEYLGMAVWVSPTGRMQAVFLPTGQVLEERSLIPEGKAVTARSYARQQGAIAFGFQDGMVQLGTIGFDAAFVRLDDATSAMKAMAVGERAVEGKGYVERTSLDGWRRVRVNAEMREPTELKSGSGAVTLIDYRPGGTSGADFIAAVREQGAELDRVSTVRPLGGGTPRVSLQSSPFELTREGGGGGGGVGAAPLAMFVSGDGADLFVPYHDGRVRRFAITRGPEGEDVVQKADDLNVARSGETLTSATMLLGAKTLVLGTSQGRVLALFAVRAPGVSTPDQRKLVLAHEPGGPGTSAISSLAVALRDRSFVVGDEAGRSVLRNMTSGKLVAETNSPGGTASPVAAVEIAPKGDAVLKVMGDGSYQVWSVEPGHAEASALSLFGKVWYEGESEPSHTYQSSSGEDSAEPKLGLTPLIWGTLKATFYAMIFAVPLAILAAIYTSEMLHPGVRNRVKPVVESMASLPSVVLGFVAALIVAPFARDFLASVLLALFVVPVGVLIAAYLFQMLPIRVTTRLGSGRHFLLVLGVTLLGLLASVPIGRGVERVLFSPTDNEVLVMAGSFEPARADQVPAWVGTKLSLTSEEQDTLRRLGLYWRDGKVVQAKGSLNEPSVAAIVERNGLRRADIKLWLDGIIGGAWPGWFMLLVAPGAAIALMLKVRTVDPILDRRAELRTGTRAAVVEFAKFVCVLAIAMVFAAIGAWVLSTIGMDARDSIMGPFNQRNSLVVGIIMGFAIIPIIYTVSEDALSAVSPSLRSASLGAGATRWQTAIRVVLPVAASGIFSACMIGLGRAAGETMIVLMATGNTPSMDTSMFSGFRTLAANIAVELPEAPVDSTHYRVLFLCGLVLLVMTFIVNTAAELVRQRFRRRVAGL